MVLKRLIHAPLKHPTLSARCIVACLLALVALSGCGRKKTRLPTVTTPSAGAVETGIASWYGHPYHGRRAANGEIYNMEMMTAAHRTLQFGTWVRVWKLDNGKTVEVRITDRGPFVEGRIIDLSRAAARQIDMIGPGTSKVRIEVISAPAEFAGSIAYAVQVGAFREFDNARRMQREMESLYGHAQLASKDGDPTVWRVLVGRELTRELAAGLAERIRAETGPAFVVRVD